jgi:uncharacterized membrane protein
VEIKDIGGVPAHPLFVHIPVVFIPVAAIVAIVMALRPVWLDRFGWWLVGISGVGFVGAVLAGSSGETLQSSVPRSPGLSEHMQMGETARLTSAAFFFGVLTIVVVRRWATKNVGQSGGAATLIDASATIRRVVTSKAGTVVACVALVVLALLAAVTVIDAGHKGAQVSWRDVHVTG